MKYKLSIVLLASMASFNALASSPFMVNHSSVESNSSPTVVEPVSDNTSSKSTTLAETLVQLRHCNELSHDDDASSSKSKVKAPSVEEQLN